MISKKPQSIKAIIFMQIIYKFLLCICWLYIHVFFLKKPTKIFLDLLVVPKQRVCVYHTDVFLADQNSGEDNIRG